MSERNYSQRLMNALRKHGHATRIENVVGVGMPDVSYCVNGIEGFIENKWLAEWPKNPERIVTLRGFRAQQRVWINERARAGGRVWVALYVSQPQVSALLFHGEWAANHLGLVTRDELHAHAHCACVGAIDWVKFVRALTT